MTVSQLEVRVTTAAAAGGRCRLGIYNSAASGAPGSLLLDAGTALVDSTGVKTITGLSTVLTSGTYWLAAHNELAASYLAMSVGYPMMTGTDPPGFQKATVTTAFAVLASTAVAPAYAGVYGMTAVGFCWLYTSN